MPHNTGAIPHSFYSTDGSKLSRLAYLFLVMLCFAFFTPGLVTLPPTDRDESSFAQASKQMIETNDYIDIRLQNEPRYKKPIGIYWLQSAAVRIFNPKHLDQIWAYRLPSFAGATLAVILTAEIGSLLFTPAVGLLAGMMLAGCVLLNVEARLAKTDAALLACILGAMYGLARAYLGQVQGWVVPFAFWTAFSFGVLIKGPIILLPVGATLVWLYIADKNLGWFRALRPKIGIPFAILIVTPWLLAITVQSHGAFLQQSAGNDMFAKILNGQNRGFLPPGLHLLALPLAFFPFALFVIFAFPDVWKNRHETAVKFCLGWIVPTWIIFELSFTKLPHYVLPTYPALALLTAKFLVDGFPSVTAATRRLPIALTTAVWLAIGFGYAGLFAALPKFVEGTWMWPQIVAGVILMLSQIFALAAFMKDKSFSVISLTISSMIFLTTTIGQTLPDLNHLWVSREIVSEVEAASICRHPQIVSFGYHEPSLVFLAGTDTLLTNTAAETIQLMRDGPCRVAVIDQRNKAAFTEASMAQHEVPSEMGSIQGLNAGHGSEAFLTLYRLRAEADPITNAPAPSQP